MAYLLTDVPREDIPLEKRHIQMVVPLEQSHAFRVNCHVDGCGGHTDVAMSVCTFILGVRCSKCHIEFPLDQLMPLFQMVKKYREDRLCDVSLVVRLDRCTEK